MSFTFRRAIRENVPLIIGMAGGTGSGKTYSAMRLARGICGDKPFAVIDTEAGRAKHYADLFAFDHGDLCPPFCPQTYINAIEAADKSGYRVIVVDSVSHVWAGDGGVLDWQDEEWSKKGYSEGARMLSWVKPKMEHKKFVQKLLQLRAHLILCLRAEPKIEMVKGADGKWEVVPKKTLTSLDGWIPVCEKSLPFEMTISFLLTAHKPGVPQPIKLQEQHRPIFDLTKPITEDQGRRLAEWATGAKKEPVPLSPSSASPPPTESTAPLPHAVPLADRSCSELVRYIGTLRDGIGHEKATEIIIGNFNGPVSSFKNDREKLLRCIEKMEET